MTRRIDSPMRQIHRALSCVVLALCLLLGSWQSYAQSNAFEAGVKAYSEADYDSAIRFFTDALESDPQGPTAELYYNLGASHYKRGDLPAAILNFERAYRLDPSDADIEFNLRLTQSQQMDKLEATPQLLISKWWQSLSHVMSLYGWRIVVLLTFGFLLAGLYFYLRAESRRLRKVGFFSALASLCLFVLSLALMLQLNGFVYDQDEAILMQEVMTIKSSPDASAEDIVVVHGGLKVECLQELAGYTEVRLADGTIGWIPSSDLERINDFE